MILGIESSCDESAIAVFDPGSGLKGEWVSSQITLHREYGGVVPDLASREHLENFEPLLHELRQAIDLKDISQLAVTQGPGLAACLALGLTVAKSIATIIDKPVVGVNHLVGHAFSPFIPVHKVSPQEFEDKASSMLPHLGLIVSGGNTLVVEINRHREIQTVASTVDDAAGEALDKGAKLLGLNYPGGPEIEKLSTGGDVSAYDFPVSFPNPSDHKFSFSGLKTSLRYTLEKMTDDEVQKAMSDLCASYQEAVIKQLIRKLRHILDGGDYASIGLSGGVANNSRLRELFLELGNEWGIPSLIAERRHTGDNASMIAFASWLNPDLNHQPQQHAPLGIEPSLRLQAN